jgi:DNA polymerase
LQHPDDLFADFETRSRTDLKKAGARRYAADPSTQITTAVWYFRGAWKTVCTVFSQLGTHTLADLYADVRLCRRFVAHHANFDVSILKAVNPFVDLPLSKIDCTMGRAQAVALPGGLDQVCTALGIKGKDPRGRALVMATCKPQRDGTFKEDLQTFYDLLQYNVQDVSCLIELDARLPALSADERLVFERTWRKNEIGLPIDLQLATAIALRRQEIEQETTLRLIELTQGAVTKLSQRQRIVEWCNSGNRAAGLESTQKHIVAEKLQDEDLHPDVREVLELLQSEGGSAPLKAQALLDRHVGGFYKDATRYFGARSGRGTSEGANMFNIARPSGKFDGKDGRQTIDQVIQGLKNGFRYDNIALTDCLRGCIVAPDGWMICDNDESQAEYRIALWLAGDQERLNLLASGGDPYMYNAIAMGRAPAGATKNTHPKERQEYKSVTLGGNYQLGWRTYMALQRRAGMRMDEIKAQSDISGYRSANPKLEKLWYDLIDAFKYAIYEQPGRVFPVGQIGKIAFQKDGNGTVWMILPSGRPIPHYSAHITAFGEAAFFRGKFGAMLRQKAFGGSLLEIACQSMTRDLVTAAEADIERELPDVFLILDVYDSILALAPAHVAAERSAQMRDIMKRPRSWTAGLPLDCEGYEAPRMRK